MVVFTEYTLQKKENQQFFSKYKIKEVNIMLSGWEMKSKKREKFYDFRLQKLKMMLYYDYNFRK